MADEQVWTIGRILKWSEQYFQSRGIDTPRLDAEVLLSYVLGEKRIFLFLISPPMPLLLLFTVVIFLPPAGLPARTHTSFLLCRTAGGRPANRPATFTIPHPGLFLLFCCDFRLLSCFCSLRLL